MQPDGHCVFRAIAHAVLDHQDDWNDIRTSLLNHLESYGEDDANPHVLAAGTNFRELKDSLECRAAEGAPRSQWFNDTWHGQLVTDFYNVFVVSAEKVGGTKVLIRACYSQRLKMDVYRHCLRKFIARVDKRCAFLGFSERILVAATGKRQSCPEQF